MTFLQKYVRKRAITCTKKGTKADRLAIIREFSDLMEREFGQEHRRMGWQKLASLNLHIKRN